MTPRPDAEDGFTLFEALVGVALTGLILALLATVTGQWLPNWRTGFARLQTAELAGLALDRITADLAAAEYVAAPGQPGPLFVGSAASVVFVRTPLGPRPAKGPAPTGLEIVRFLHSAAEGGLVRSRSVFTPEAGAAALGPDFAFADSTLLLRAPIEVSFGFAGPDRAWADFWTDPTTLPIAIRVTVRNAQTNDILAYSTATLLHVNAPPTCALANAADAACPDAGGKGAAPPPRQGGQGPPRSML